MGKRKFITSPQWHKDKIMDGATLMQCPKLKKIRVPLGQLRSQNL